MDISLLDQMSFHNAGGAVFEAEAKEIGTTVEEAVIKPTIVDMIYGATRGTDIGSKDLGITI